DPSGNRSSSSAARAWKSRLYSTTGGQTVATRASEATVAQPVSEIAAITRTASRRIEHLALDVIGLLRGFEAFDEPASTLAGAPEREQEQKHGECGGAVAVGRPYPRGSGDPGEQSSDHRRPRFQSSRR